MAAGSKAVRAAAALVAATACLGGIWPAHADIYVNGGADDLITPALLLEFQIVYAGQHYTGVPVGSAPAVAGFIANDCTFGVLPDCSWSPLGSGTAVDFAVSAIPLTAAEVQGYDDALGMTDGPPIQFPLYAVPLAIVARQGGITSNGQLAMGDGALCGIFSGQLTDWSQFSNNVRPGGFSIVYDGNPGSGATWLLTQHLNAVCDSTNSDFTQYPVPVTSDFSSLPIAGGVGSNTRFVAAADNAGMQQALLASASAIGYIGPSYTSVAPNSPVTSTLYVASLQNSQDLKLYQPTAGSAASAMHNFGPGAQKTAPPANMLAGADPTNWVPVNPQPSAGYPITGFASWVLSSCYASVGKFLLQYLAQPYQPAQHQAVIADAGFAAVGSADNPLGKAITANLLHNRNGWGIDLQDPVTCLNYKGR